MHKGLLINAKSRQFLRFLLDFESWHESCYSKSGGKFREIYERSR